MLFRSQASLVEFETETDLALLKVATPTLLAPIRPIDVALRFPGADDNLFSMGYPKLGDQPNLQPREQPVSIVATLSNGFIEVKQTQAVGGASGGPLLNGWGSAIGTCHEEVGVGGVTARYVPMTSAHRLLDRIPMSATIQKMDARLKAGTIDPAALGLLLKMSSRNPTNLELYTWVRYIIEHPGEYERADKLIACPLMPALMHRKLDDLVVDLANRQRHLAMLVDPNELGDAYLHVALHESKFSALLLNDNAKRALEAYTKAGNAQGILTSKFLLAQRQHMVFADFKANLESNTYIDAVMRDIATLPPEYRPDAYLLAAAIDARNGNTKAALEKFDKATDLFRGAKRYSRAADALASGAWLRFNSGDSAGGLESYANAVSLYKQGEDRNGHAYALWQLAKMQSAAGEEGAAKRTLAEFESVAPRSKALEYGRIYTWGGEFKCDAFLSQACGPQEGVWQ